MRTFDLSLDLPDLNAWYAARGEPGWTADMVPPTGYIEPGVAAGFLFITNTTIALMEGMVTNPRADPAARDRALDEIAHLLLAEARQAPFGATIRQVYLFTQIGAIERRALKHGFIKTGQYVMMARAI